MGAAFLLLKILTYTKELIMEFTAFSRQVIDQLESDITAYIQACKLPSPLHDASPVSYTHL